MMAQKQIKNKNSLTESPTQRKHRLKMSVFLTLFGCAFIAIGVVTIKSWHISKSWARTTGTITSYAAYTDNKQHRTYAPVATYSIDGQLYTVTKSSSSSERPEVGSKLEIAYNPANPAEAKIPSDNIDKYALTLLFAFGIFALFLGYINFASPYLLRREQEKRMRKKSGLKSRAASGQ